MPLLAKDRVVATFNKVYPKRYKDPPPAGTKPDPDYVPKEGEWFWWRGYDNLTYHRYQRGEDDTILEQDGSNCYDGWEDEDKGKCLPAEPPD